MNNFIFRFIIAIIKRFRFWLRTRGKHVVVHSRCNIGFASWFEGRNVIRCDTSFVGRIGYGSFVGAHCSIDAKIGRYCSVGSFVRTISSRHPTRGFVSCHPAFYSTLKQNGETFVKSSLFNEEMSAEPDKQFAVTIGNDVWIGQGVSILGGVEIGDGAVVGAGAVVTRNVSPYTIVAGVPAKAIRKRFADEEIDFLIAFRWWDKDKQWLKENSSDFADIEGFMERFK